ncbi:MAG: thioredoxin family protein [Pseudomonadota bacterium]
MAYASGVLLRTSCAGKRLPRPGLPALLAALLVTVLGACGRPAPKPRKETPVAAPSNALNALDAPPPSFLHFPRKGGAIEPWVQEQVELAEAAHVRVLVYVGASWCEPCQRFHQAVEHGELNGTLNGLRFLEFDQDQDAAALKTAGYLYQYIPVLALPDPDGRNHGKMISGSIKGPSAVKTNLVPRLQALLSGQAVD